MNQTFVSWLEDMRAAVETTRASWQQASSNRSGTRHCGDERLTAPRSRSISSPAKKTQAVLAAVAVGVRVVARREVHRVVPVRIPAESELANVLVRRVRQRQRHAVLEQLASRCGRMLGRVRQATRDQAAAASSDSSDSGSSSRPPSFVLASASEDRKVPCGDLPALQSTMHVARKLWPSLLPSLATPRKQPWAS